jgi:hypothetical protein
MLRSFQWIGSLPAVLQTGIDSAVSAELHSTAANICKFKPRRNAGESCGHLEALGPTAAQADYAQTGPSNDKIAA